MKLKIKKRLKKHYYLVVFDGILPNGDSYRGNVDCWVATTDTQPPAWTLKAVRDTEKEFCVKFGLSKAFISNVIALAPPVKGK